MKPPTGRKSGVRHAAGLIGVAGLLFLMSVSARAGEPYSAYYHWSGSRLFWFMVISDSHIGTSGSQDTTYLTWAVTEARSTIDPLFIVNCGDLTDSTNGGVIPNGPYTAEWQSYRNLLTATGIDASFYYDIPGNHDHYNDEIFAFYRNYSIQGAATGATQHSWTPRVSPSTSCGRIRRSCPAASPARILGNSMALPSRRASRGPR